jgi:hypothetical protein
MGVLVDAIVVDVVLDLIVVHVEVAVAVAVHFAELIDCLVFFSLLTRYWINFVSIFYMCVCKKLKIRNRGFYKGCMRVIRIVEVC